MVLFHKEQQLVKVMQNNLTECKLKLALRIIFLLKFLQGIMELIVTYGQQDAFYISYSVGIHHSMGMMIRKSYRWLQKESSISTERNGIIFLRRLKT